MTAKWAVQRVVVDHVRTLVDFRTGKYRIADLAAFYLTPALSGVIYYFFDGRLKGLGSALNGVAIATGLLFGLLVHVFQLRARISDSEFLGSILHLDETIDQLEANVSYCILSGLATTVAIIVVVNYRGDNMAAGRLDGALIVALGVHLLIGVMMVLKRVRLIYPRVVR